jgi:uncharacterized protein
MQQVNLRSFRRKARLYKRTLRRFLTKVEKNPPAHLDKLAQQLNNEVWTQVDCISCANCCKTMSPTYTPEDIKRISAYLNITPKKFKEKWLNYDKKDGDWMNKSTPCQFLDLNTNMCTVYEVRPKDCAGFPHFTKRKMIDYMHVHKQNLEYCPATFKMVQGMMEQLSLKFEA